jgi:hypothetical protein
VTKSQATTNEVVCAHIVTVATVNANAKNEVVYGSAKARQANTGTPLVIVIVSIGRTPHFPSFSLKKNLKNLKNMN